MKRDRMCNCITAHAHLYNYPLVRASPRHPGKEPNVSDKRIRSGSEKRQRTVLRAIRFSPEEDELIGEKAEKSGLPVSAFIRNAALNKRVNARIDDQFLTELMRLGRMQKHLFVEGKRTGDKAYADVLVAITRLADTLRNQLMED